MSEATINMNPKFNRWIPVIASIAIQMCLGTAYIWSVFQTGIAKSLFNGNSASAALAFSLLLGVLTVGSTFGGMLQDKYGPKPVIISGGIILSIGFLMASFTTSANPWLLWVSYGILGGIGMGFTYSTTIACCQKWFPDKRGFITGIIVSALGFGGVIFTPIAENLIKKLGNGAVGVGELKTFAFLAIIFIIVCTVGAFFIKNPPVGFKPAGWNPPAPKAGIVHQDFKPMEVLKTPQFYVVTITLMLACMAGLMMIGFAKPIALAKKISPQEAYYGVMIISVFNSFGRLFWGWISDKLGRKNTLLLLLVLTGGTILFVNLATGYYIFALIALVGFSYGGFLGVFPALTADFWGTKNMGMNYGMVLLGFGVGAIVASNIAGIYRDIAAKGNDINLMFPAFIIASAAAFLGAILIYFVKHPELKKEVSVKSDTAVEN